MNELASDRIDVRVGGIHGLERISIGREPELESALMILTAFVLQRSREHDSAATAGVLPLDLQIALAVLVRFQRSRTKWPVARASLRGISSATRGCPTSISRHLTLSVPTFARRCSTAHISMVRI